MGWSSVPYPSLRATYLAYLDAVNERRFGDLAEFVHDEITYNDTTVIRQEFADLLAADAKAVPDLHFEVQLLVNSEDAVAVRLWCDCAPAEPMFGLAPTGRRVEFAEHGFYRFDHGRIAHVWSLIDNQLIQAQLAG
ncbi:ester cyclase [Promicromonospora sukumoe]